MATFTKQEFTIIPAETVVTAEVVNAEEKETPFWADDNDHSKGKSRQVSFRFKVLDGEYEDTIIFGNTGVYYSDNSKLGGWVREILAVDELPDEFDTDNLIGAIVKIIVGNRSKDVNGVATVTGHFAETIARVTDDDYLAADEVF